MKIKYIKLNPIKEKPDDYKAIEKEIIRIFWEEIYFPLLKELKGKKIVKNSLEDLVEAIKKGKISFNRGKFTGRFDAKVSKELINYGAKWVGDGFLIQKSELPVDARVAISSSENAFQLVLKKIDDKLKAFIPKELSHKMKLTELFNKELWKVDGKVNDSLKAISIPYKLSEEQALIISKGYTDNLDRYITHFSEEETKKLRLMISQQVGKGIRYEETAKLIQKSFGVTHRKAKFLARQETSLMMTAYKQSKYQSAGVNEYIWSCVKMPHDKSPNQHTPGNVRYYHGLLDGKIFRWDNPPITDAKGNRNNPGEDFNCRCFARPVVKVK